VNFLFREAADGYRVNLSGPLNIGRSENVVQLFLELSEGGAERVVVNLEDVPFIDGQGLAALVAGYRIFGGDPESFRLIGMQDQPRLVFELTGFDHVFQTDVRLPEDRFEARAFSLPVYVPQVAVSDLVA
jgi:anti-anti-sigma factor